MFPKKLSKTEFKMKLFGFDDQFGNRDAAVGLSVRWLLASDYVSSETLSDGNCCHRLKPEFRLKLPG